MTDEPRWQPIGTAPKDGSVLIATDGECVATVGFFNGRFCWVEGTGPAWSGNSEHGGLSDCDWKLTHWMALPSPPNGP